jgi:parallel beta-helix repeat protein
LSRIASALIIALLFLSLFTLSFTIQTARAQSGTIYIMPDGSISPSTAPISTVDNITYTLTGNINGSIVVQRNNIVIDGADHTLQGTGSGYGFNLTNVSGVTIRNTNIENFLTGIYLNSASQNIITENNATANTWAGVFLDSSPRNELRSNSMVSNGQGFAVHGFAVSDFVEDVDTSNTVDGKPIYYWVNIQGLSVPSDAGTVVLVNCTGIKVGNLNLTESGQNVQLAFTTNSTITENTIKNSWFGIWLYNSLSNNVSGNTASTNIWGGIVLNSCSNNTVSGNNATANSVVGIELYSCSNNTVSGNNATANGKDGIYFGSSSNYNSVEGNIATANSWYGIDLDSSSSNTISATL